MSEQGNNKTDFKRPFYMNTFLILILSALWLFAGIPFLVAIALAFIQMKYDKKYVSTLKDRVTQEVEINCIEIVRKAEKDAENIKREAQNKADMIKSNAERNHIDLINSVKQLTDKKNDLSNHNESLEIKVSKLTTQESNLKIKIKKLKSAHKAVVESIKYYQEHGEYEEVDIDIKQLLYPTVELPLHTNDVKVLKQQSNEVKKHINSLITNYEKRYTTKANKSIYSLMVIALQSELQNILISLKYDKIENTRTNVKEVSLKYIEIAGKGNKQIYSTLVKFIGELESLFLDLVNIEYEYYVKREQQKEEQRLIREQMAQEAAERKLLKEQQKKIEKEEQKYHQEIDNLQSMLTDETDNKKLSELEKRIAELNLLLQEVEEKKEEIVNLQNGKAGNVYIISNIGSFGKNMFKVGMTRRLEPMDRVKELSSASVPFSFDVHSFIFSEDAPSLEKRLHDSLHDNRVNKVNIRKEFFTSTIDEMEKLVSELDPTAEFKKTLIAQEYQQTLEIISNNQIA